MNDTIVAISTALGEGAISIIRVSGDDAIKIINPLFDGKDLEKASKDVIDSFTREIDNFEFGNSLKEIWSYISRTNKYIDETSPWALAKDEENIEKLKSCIYHLVANLREIAILIRPLMKDTSDNMLRQLGMSDNVNWDTLKEYKDIKDIKVIEKGEPIFMRLKEDEEVETIKNMMKQ